MFGYRRKVTTIVPPVVSQSVATGLYAPGAVVVTPATAATIPVETAYVTTNHDNTYLAVSSRLQAIVALVYLVAAILILARFILLAMGASMTGQFAVLVSTLSHPLVKPFLTLFDNPRVAYFLTFEVGDLIGLVVYAIVTSLICYVIALLLDPSRRDRRI